MDMGKIHWDLCPTPLYSEIDIRYQQEYSGPYEDLSLIGEEGMLVMSRKDGHISGFGRPALLFGKLREKVLKDHLDSILPTRGVFCDYVVGGELNPATLYLLKQGFDARPQFTQVIDLRQTAVQLHEGLRKSYSNLVNRSSGECWDARAFQRLRDFHMAQHGETRSIHTWAMQFEMLGHSAVCAADDGAAALVYYNAKHAYYACGSSLPDATSHAVLWRLILKCQELGIEDFEMGEQVFVGDPKLRNISKFKRGFGGSLKMRLILEKK